jgi:hypothetical protein
MGGVEDCGGIAVVEMFPEVRDPLDRVVFELFPDTPDVELLLMLEILGSEKCLCLGSCWGSPKHLGLD